MKAQLIIVEGKQRGRAIDLGAGGFVIGRGERCHLRPVSELVSREHAEFSLGETGLTVRDMGSRNGTLVNGKSVVTEQALADGDRVQVGPLVFAVSLQPGTAEAPAAPVHAPPSGKGAKQPETEEAQGVPHGDSTIMIPAFKTQPQGPRAKSKDKGKGSKAAKKPDSASGQAGGEILRKMMQQKGKPKN